MIDLEQVKEEIYALETKLLKPETRASRDELDQLLADDFFEFGSSGHSFDKENVLNRLPKAKQAEGFSLTNFDARLLASDVVLTTFKTYKASKDQYALRSSIWKKNNGRWQMTFHQGTLIERLKKGR
ncbi:DUF4440 domain-containing protein [Pontibacillus sp. HMF3514]|uniref:nuclear transport factor 2 family protein n=1 Tax=Pontibacillus sp. HMF3514 TaxID=2692425 RepID=UPI00131FF379|nr:DUF4440 domain-containing protein [Pontibacillus sp. HMF3514]QHE51489.1 DUF4440 domain-containing protein [Pontibacillus sp. HMF3514]